MARTRKTFPVIVRTFTPDTIVQVAPAVVSDTFITAFHDTSWDEHAAPRVTLNRAHRVR